MLGVAGVHGVGTGHRVVGAGVGVCAERCERSGGWGGGGTCTGDKTGDHTEPNSSQDAQVCCQAAPRPNTQPLLCHRPRHAHRLVVTNAHPQAGPSALSHHQSPPTPNTHTHPLHVREAHLVCIAQHRHHQALGGSHRDGDVLVVAVHNVVPIYDRVDRRHLLQAVDRRLWGRQPGGGGWT